MGAVIGGSAVAVGSAGVAVAVGVGDNVAKSVSAQPNPTVNATKTTSKFQSLRVIAPISIVSLIFSIIVPYFTTISRSAYNSGFGLY